MAVFVSAWSQIAFLFALILIGFVLGKFRVVPEGSSQILAKLENVLFVPALVMGTFIQNFTIEQISSTWKLLLASLCLVLLNIPLMSLISCWVTKDSYQRNIYTYGLVFSNFGFMGNAVVSALFPDIFLEYILFTLPFWVLIYLWGVPCLLIADAGKKQTMQERVKNFLNPMFVGMLIGMGIGLFSIPIPGWLMKTVTTAGDCMSPIAMLLTGITVSSIDWKKTFTDWRIYLVSLIRLLLIPLVFLGIGRIVPMDTTIFVCALCVLAMPLGLNTIVIPGAYGKDTSVAAGMAVVSHLLACISIPLVFSLL